METLLVNILNLSCQNLAKTSQSLQDQLENKKLTNSNGNLTEIGQFQGLLHQ